MKWELKQGTLLMLKDNIIATVSDSILQHRIVMVRVKIDQSHKLIHEEEIDYIIHKYEYPEYYL